MDRFSTLLEREMEITLLQVRELTKLKEVSGQISDELKSLITVNPFQTRKNIQYSLNKLNTYKKLFKGRTQYIQNPAMKISELFILIVIH